MDLARMLDHIKVEKKYGEILDQMRRVDRSRCCWESPIEELELHELEQLRGALEQLKKTIAKQVNNILTEPTSFLPFSTVNGEEEVGDFWAKLEIDNTSATLHFNNLGRAISQENGSFSHPINPISTSGLSCASRQNPESGSLEHYSTYVRSEGQQVHAPISAPPHDVFPHCSAGGNFYPPPELNAAQVHYKQYNRHCIHEVEGGDK
ncbi:hypothetical protein SADUNF_Sadunf08G0030300 [Salix dunnii]|uniref:Uncharacterized protein n=1 Tax=Salix dunnii TaxID=1413687 RepID=A0A835MX52_9ROSI|nr:hypothetical protein SADUNF_Sadunf08G0030300 [Salix dunnii]